MDTELLAKKQSFSDNDDVVEFVEEVIIGAHSIDDKATMTQELNTTTESSNLSICTISSTSSNSHTFDLHEIDDPTIDTVAKSNHTEHEEELIDQKSAGKKIVSEHISLSKTMNMAAQKPPSITPITQSKFPSNKILYVKIIPVSQGQPAIVATATSTASITIASIKEKTDSSMNKLEVKSSARAQSQPILIQPSITIAPIGGGNHNNLQQPVEHTVNLLNNNKILIKSVKNYSNTNCAQAIAISTAAATTTSTQLKSVDEAKCRKIDDTNCLSSNSIMSTVPSTATETSHFVKTATSDSENIKLEYETYADVNTPNKMGENTTIDIDLKTTPLSITTTTQKIKREFEQLQKTVNESKILSEFIIDRNKRGRRSTKSAKKHKTGMLIDEMTTVDDKTTPINRSRSISRTTSPPNSVRSISKESDRSGTGSFQSNVGGVAGPSSKRSTRSQNIDFSAKQKRFLKGIQQITRGTDEDTDNSALDDDEDDLDFYIDNDSKLSHGSAERRKSTTVASKKLSINDSSKDDNAKTGWDKYCWRCHQNQSNVFCSSCIRSYHAACIKLKQTAQQELEKWQCSECIELDAVQNDDSKKWDVKHFNKLLKFAMNRILQDATLQQFQFPVSKTQYPDYNDVILYPINLSKIENQINENKYTTAEAFLSEIKWILHNCSIYFSHNYKLMRAAKVLQKVCKQEIYDIETCAECYLNANTMTDNWFIEACAKPHLILWAKLKGFPYWPAKAMAINAQLVDVRFFGEHDRAHVPAKDCFLYSRQDPNPPTNKYKRNTIADCVKEVDIYIENVIAKFGSFNYSELRTPFNPLMETQHLVEMIPGVRSIPARRRSTSFKSDLTLKIVKTADNNLSVVKTGQTDQSPSKDSDLAATAKKTNDANDGVAISRTPTPTSTSRKKNGETKNKSTKSINRNPTNENKQTSVQHKSYKVLRRKSMVAEKVEQKKVGAVILKRKSIHSNSQVEQINLPKVVLSREKSIDGMGASAEKDTKENDVIEVTKTTKPIPENSLKGNPKSFAKVNSSSRKRKASNDEMIASEEYEALDKVSRRFESSVAQKNTSNALDLNEIDKNDEGVEEENFLSSVGLVKKSSATKKDDSKRESNASRTTEMETNKQDDSSKHTQPNLDLAKSVKSICDKNRDEDRRSIDEAGHEHNNSKQTLRVIDKSPIIVLIPFIEPKEEPNDDAPKTPTTTTPPTTTTTVSNDSDVIELPVSTSSSTTNSAEKARNRYSDETVRLIKTEQNSSDDEGLMIIEDNNVSASSADSAFNRSSRSPPGVAKLIDNIKRGGITVRDINKMTVNETSLSRDATRSVAAPKHQKRGANPRARKTFPSSGLHLTPMPTFANSRNNTIANKSTPMNNMVYIPLDGNHFSHLDMTFNSSQPPPLTVVGSSSNISPFTQIPSMPHTSNSSSSNGPPPLSLSSLPPASPSSLSSSSAVTTSIANQTQNGPNIVQHHPNTTSLLNSNSMSTIANGMLTEQLAAAVTDSIVRAPPKLTSRPTAPLRSDGDFVFPSEAGSVCKTLMENAHKMTDFFRSVIEDTLSDIANTTNPEAKIKLLELELEKQKSTHAKEMMELKSNTDTLLNEMKKSMEKERIRTINETRKQCEIERIRSVEETKKKQWCINCGKEAQFYCCWNTSYCDYACQRKHWERHMTTCAQLDKNSKDASQNSRKSNARTAPPKPDMRTIQHQQTVSSQLQQNHQLNALMSPGQKDNAVLIAHSSSRNINQAAALRNILPKKSLVPINAITSNARQSNQQIKLSSQQQLQQKQQISSTSNTQSPCFAIVNRHGTWERFSANAASNSVTNIGAGSGSTASLLNSNAILISTSTVNQASAPSYATITSVQSQSASSVATAIQPPLLANTTNTKSTMLVQNETIIIP